MLPASVGCFGADVGCGVAGRGCDGGWGAKPIPPQTFESSLSLIVCMTSNNSSLHATRMFARSETDDALARRARVTDRSHEAATVSELTSADKTRLTRCAAGWSPLSASRSAHLRRRGGGPTLVRARPSGARRASNSARTGVLAGRRDREAVLLNMDALIGGHRARSARRDARWGEWDGSAGPEGTGTSPLDRGGTRTLDRRSRCSCVAQECVVINHCQRSIAVSARWTRSGVARTVVELVGRPSPRAVRGEHRKVAVVLCFGSAGRMATADRSKRCTARPDRQASRVWSERVPRLEPGLLAAAISWRLQPTSAVAGPAVRHFP